MKSMYSPNAQNKFFAITILIGREWFVYKGFNKTPELTQDAKHTKVFTSRAQAYKVAEKYFPKHTFTVHGSVLELGVIKAVVDQLWKPRS